MAFIRRPPSVGLVRCQWCWTVIAGRRYRRCSSSSREACVLQRIRKLLNKKRISFFHNSQSFASRSSVRLARAGCSSRCNSFPVNTKSQWNLKRGNIWSPKRIIQSSLVFLNWWVANQNYFVDLTKHILDKYSFKLDVHTLRPCVYI